jgi:hypothetical protein
MLLERLADLRRVEAARAMAAAREWRKELADLWLRLPVRAVPAVYAGLFGGIQRMLVACGIRGAGNAAQEQEELKALGWRAEALEAPASLEAIPQLLAGILYLRGQELAAPSILGQLPGWIRAEIERMEAGPGAPEPSGGGPNVAILGNTGTGGVVISFRKNAPG